MNSPNLAMMCLTAFSSVFILLTVLALVMKLITSLFPGKAAAAAKPSLAGGGGGATDAALLAAITTTATSAYPGMKVTKIEELR